MPQNEALKTMSDEAIVKITLEFPDTFAEIMVRYESRLSRYVRRIGYFSDDEVADILQDVFIKTYEHLNDFDPELKFSSWIYRITHNEAVNTIRKKRTVTFGSNETYRNIVEGIISDEDHATELDRKLEDEKIRRAIGRLGDKYRNALVLRYLEERSYDEISDILKIPIGTVGTLLNRAKKKMVELLVHNI